MTIRMVLNHCESLMLISRKDGVINVIDDLTIDTKFKL